MSPSIAAFQELQRRAEEVLNRYQSDSQSGDHSGDANFGPACEVDALSGADTTETESERFEEVAVDLKTPPVKESSISDDSETDDPARTAAVDSGGGDDSSQRIDDFMTSLEALRSTLRGRSHDDADETVAPEPVETEPDATDDSESEADIPELPPMEDEPVSALDRMPLPEVTGSDMDRSRNDAETVSDKESEAARKDEDYPSSGSSLGDAMRTIRQSLSIEMEAPMECETPPPSAKELKRIRKTGKGGKRRPLSDGIPKSISEDLPKYRSRPKMRICNRCGHETGLREPRCGKCGHTDESLGILDAVIAGDLSRVEQILLARPHLIGVRTSRHEWTLLHMAASGGNRKMAELLIQKGASINATNKDGKTSLHYAAGKGHLSIVKTLLSNHADLEIRYHGKTCEELAREHHQDEIAAYLAAYRAEQ